LLVVSVLNRAAANDFATAASAFLLFSGQALTLLVALIFLPRRWLWLLLLLVAASAFVNITYGDILDDVIDPAKLSWLLAERRQAGEAGPLFAAPAILAAGKTALALALLIAARRLLRPASTSLAARAHLSGARLWLPLSLLILTPSFTVEAPVAAERNIYGYAAKLLTAPPPPPREQVSAAVDRGRQIEKIVWLVDESVTHDVFAELVLPNLVRFRPIDFGNAAALGNCSGPAHVALRSGIEVRRIGPATDLRRMPTIWGYARNAGYRTILIDGQVTGPPQNMLIDSERVLIDDYVGAASGLDTDRRVARMINERLRTDGRQFIYAALRGVHFQYGDHVPEGTLPKGSPLAEQYRAAVAYSKRGLFDLLLEGIDRDKVAIVYTSDHGQNVGEGAVPHCSEDPVAAEFSVPLVALLPEALATTFPGPEGGRSASQIFPTTLQFMGYDPVSAQQRYDRDLRHPTARYVWLGRGALPLGPGDSIDVSGGADFPGS
jgi:Sulfatase